MISIEDPQMVMVEWEDSEMTEGWKTKPELLEYLDAPISVIQSVGWLLLDDENYAVIAQSIDREHPSGFLAGDCIKIPKALVKKVAKLKVYATGGLVDPASIPLFDEMSPQKEMISDFRTDGLVVSAAAPPEQD